MTIQYPEVCAMQLDMDGNYYCRHVEAMTVEGLHSKSGIAKQLGWRDRELDQLRKDKARLDFIEKNYAAVTTQERYMPLQLIWGKGCNGRSLREAVDKYMNKEKE